MEGPAPGPSPRTYEAGQVFTVEVWGAQAPDTVVTFASSSGRSIILRHGPPDNTVFAEVDIPAGALYAETLDWRKRSAAAGEDCLSCSGMSAR